MKSDSAIIAETAADLARKRAAQPLRREPAPVPLPAIPAACDDPARDQRLAAEQAARDQAARSAAISRHYAALRAARGAKYELCRLENFEATLQAQEQVVARVREFCGDIVQQAALGRGVFFFGPVGTGKDHLAFAVARAFVLATAKAVAWTSGAKLFESLRDSMDDPKRSEGDVLRPLARAPLLWISDPLPAKGELTAYQSEALYRIVDDRYSASRPTIWTANIKAGAADAVFGAAMARRIRESTLHVHCNWPPFKRR